MSRGPSCRSGGEALRAARSASGAVSGAVVAGYRLADMTADELVRRLDGDAAALIIASPAHLALVEEPAARKLAAPFSPAPRCKRRSMACSRRTRAPRRSERRRKPRGFSARRNCSSRAA